jgi:Protein of unknown function (DUF4054)
VTVTVASFQKDFPREFGNEGNYPSTAIQYWISVGQVLFGMGTGSSPQVCSFTGSVNGDVLNTTAIGFGSLSLFPLLLQGNNIPSGNNSVITEQLTGTAGGIGTYQVSFESVIASEPMVALKGGTVNASNPFWGSPSLTADSPPTAVADFALEQWVAHQLVLEKQAVDAARTGGDPGTKIGIITSKSVNGVSVGFDASAVTGGKMQENAGYYAQTIYGLRFYRLMKLRGSGPIQIGIGHAPAFLFFNSFGFLGGSNAWAGPYPGIAPSDTGF